MYLIKVIPATKIPLNNPQILTYFTAHELKVGGLVLAPLHKRKVIGVVESIEKIHGQKMALRKAKFELRGIAKVISPKQVIDKKQFQLAKWISEYYWCPIGAVLKLMLPDYILSLRGRRPKQSQKDSKGSLRRSAPRDDGQSLILLPEISFIDGIAKQNKITNYATLHSELTDKQYFENWLKIKNGETKTIIATRMALFAPFQNLKEIIIENEHSDLYKSQQTPRYHAREVAIKLAELWGAKLTFKSATPSIETFWLAENRKINLESSSPQMRGGDPKGRRGAERNPSTPPPSPSQLFIEKLGGQAPSSSEEGGFNGSFTIHISVVDLRQELKDGNFSIFSRKLQESIKAALDKKEQIILFINRRGASTVLLCRDCGYVPKCQNCEAPMVYHLTPIQFLCHHCGYSEIPPVLCPNCLGTRIKFFGAGTQKVEIEFKKLFPDAETSRLDSDIVSTQATGGPTSRGRSDLQTINQSIDNFNNKKTRVLIGTQIIFNKGLNKAPLVAMMIADTFLYRPDFRSNEKTFQIISQLENLSKQEFILQTYSPENTAIQTAIKNDYSGRYARYIEHPARYKTFYKQEIKDRHELNYPPFSQLIKLTYQHKNAKKAEEETKILVEKLKTQITNKLKTNQLITILGPSPAFIPKTKGKHIWQIILKSRIADLKLRNQILQIIPPDWVVDIDPLQII